jgi:hypothetical protein
LGRLFSASRASGNPNMVVLTPSMPGHPMVVDPCTAAVVRRLNAYVSPGRWGAYDAVGDLLPEPV